MKFSLELESHEVLETLKDEVGTYQMFKDMYPSASEILDYMDFETILDEAIERDEEYAKQTIQDSAIGGLFETKYNPETNVGISDFVRKVPAEYLPYLLKSVARKATEYRYVCAFMKKDDEKEIV